MQLAENSVAKQAHDSKKVLALQLYLQQGGGKPTYASIAAQLEVSERTIQNWFSEDGIAALVNSMLPHWPTVGHARELASQEADRMLQFIVDLANGKVANARAADRLKAAQYVLAVAGVTPAAADALGDQKQPGTEEARPAGRTPAGVYSNRYFAPPNWQDEVVESKVRVLDDDGPQRPRSGTDRMKG